MECITDRVATMNDFEKDAVLIWDEMSIKSLLAYNKNTDELEGIVDHGDNNRSVNIANEALVILLQGINTRWVFPLSFYFSKDPTTSEELKRILDDAITKITKTGVKIRVGVSDQSVTNQGLFKLWQINECHPYITRENPDIIMIHDVCHIIKLIRTHIKKHGFFVHDGL